jgi:hypothetical protein
MSRAGNWKLETGNVGSFDGLRISNFEFQVSQTVFGFPLDPYTC